MAGNYQTDKKRTVVITILAVVIAVLIGVSAFFIYSYFSQKDDKKSKNTSSTPKEQSSSDVSTKDEAKNPVNQHITEIPAGTEDVTIPTEEIQFDTHGGESLLFVDGWIGKGAILGELQKELAAYPNVSADIAVVADPARLRQRNEPRQCYRLRDPRHTDRAQHLPPPVRGQRKHHQPSAEEPAAACNDTAAQLLPQYVLGLHVAHRGSHAAGDGPQSQLLSGHVRGLQRTGTREMPCHKPLAY